MGNPQVRKISGKENVLCGLVPLQIYEKPKLICFTLKLEGSDASTYPGRNEIYQGQKSSAKDF